MSNIQIQETTIITSRVVVSFTIKCLALELFTSATFLVRLLDINNDIISSQKIVLTTDQYLLWNNNDDYIINLIAGILHLNLIKIPERIEIEIKVPEIEIIISGNIINE